MFFTGYPMVRADGLNKRVGGVAILMGNGINFDVVNPIPTSGATSNEQLTITIQTTTGTLHISTLHCPKRESSREIIEGVCLGRDNVILAGEFNSKHESFGKKNRTSGGTLLKEITDDMNLARTNDNTPTHTYDSTNDKDIRPHVHLSTHNPSFQGLLGGGKSGIRPQQNYWGILPHPINKRTPQIVMLDHKADGKDINQIL